MTATSLQVCVALMVVKVASAQLAQGAVSCVQVTSSLAPCLGYVTGKGPLMPNCCNGIRSLNAAATSTHDRRQVCQCFQTLANITKNIDFGRAGGLPAKYGANVGFDCKTVK